MNLYINDYVKLVMFNLFKQKLWNTDFVSQTIHCVEHICANVRGMSQKEACKYACLFLQTQLLVTKIK